jgi:uroporphyrinogen decarboxylase
MGFSAVSFEDAPNGHTFLDEMGTEWRKAGYDYAPAGHPLADAKTVADIENHRYLDPKDPGRVEGLREEARKLHDETDFAIVADIMCGGPFEQALWLRGFENFYVDVASNEKMAQALLEKITDIDIALWDAQLSAIGDYVDVVCQGDDLGMQTGLQISPTTYRKLVKPCHDRLYSFIKSKTKAKVWMHSCGAIETVLPDLIEVGVDIINPVQKSTEGMELSQLKKDFGQDITFWGGGIDVQTFFTNATIDEIEDHVKAALDIMAPGGGYVFAATHNILPEIDGEKTYTAYMTAKENRNY